MWTAAAQSGNRSAGWFTGANTRATIIRGEQHRAGLEVEIEPEWSHVEHDREAGQRHRHPDDRVSGEPLDPGVRRPRLRLHRTLPSGHHLPSIALAVVGAAILVVLVVRFLAWLL